MKQEKLPFLSVPSTLDTKGQKNKPFKTDSVKMNLKDELISAVFHCFWQISNKPKNISMFQI